jgi:hypothetical protein
MLGQMDFSKDITLFFEGHELGDWSKHGKLLSSSGEVYELDLILVVSRDQTRMEERNHEVRLEIPIKQFRQLKENNVRIEGKPLVTLAYIERMDAGQKRDYEHLKGALGNGF